MQLDDVAKGEVIRYFGCLRGFVKLHKNGDGRGRVLVLNSPFR